MSVQQLAPVIIIKRKKVIAADGHHGGAWKVAYADFVTAMMAFFMLMWLLNATTEKQRKGIADYFSPTIPFSRISGGGSGSFGGDSVFTEETLAHNGTGGVATKSSTDEDSANNEELSDVESLLVGGGGESMLTENAQRHVVTRLTDEGLIIEIFDTKGNPLFVDEGDVPTQVFTEILTMMADLFRSVKNEVAINGHVMAYPIVLQKNPVWNLSSTRANQTRLFLQAAGLESGRIQRVTGFADRKPAAENPMSLRNNRIEIILLRSDI